MPKKIACATCGTVVNWDDCYITTNVDSSSILQAYICETCWDDEIEVVL